MENVYTDLRQRLDDLAVGFPQSGDGLEIKILQQLFTEEEAALFLDMTPLLETPEAVARRLDRELEGMAAALERMARKGLLFRRRTDGAVSYAAVPYVVGLFEFQVGRMGSDFAEVHEAYYESTYHKVIQSFKTPVLRTIPIQRTLVADSPVAPYEDVLGIIDAQERIAVAPCVCRTTRDLVGKTCDKSIENCFSFGSHADYYVENGLGRYIDKDEARAIVRRNEQEGLVMQPFNSQKIGGMCSCCGDCCGVLRSLKSQPRPAESVQSNYYAVVDADACTGCETCADRCQMDAVDIADDTAAINLDRCIGCGLCVTTCPTEAIELVKKSEDQLYVPPKSGMETYIRIMQERGKL
jgi:NAD-dependent dihydropyrimidine dehydrogenase PreA subunit